MDAMPEYPKINSLWKRDPATNRIIEGDYARPEFGYLESLDWLWTEKVDGTNIRLGYPDTPDFRGNEHAWIAGRTDNAQIHPNLLTTLIDLMKQLPLEDVFSGDSAVLYGEGYGAKIQSGGQYLPDRCDFVLFDVKVGDWWLRRHSVVEVGEKLGLRVVPSVSVAPIAHAVELVKRGGFVSAWGPTATPEGLVGKPVVDLWDRRGERIITKIKRKDFR
jgi:hypothetical protein